MKAIYRRHVLAALDARLPERFSGFAPHPLKLSKLERKAATLFTGSRLYSRTVPAGMLFIHMIPHGRQERFHAEVGWSMSGRFPVEQSSHGGFRKITDELSEPEWLIYFGELYHRKYGLGFLGWDVWKCSVEADDPNFIQVFMEEDSLLVTEEQAKEKADAAVTAFLNDLEDVAIPYFNEWMEFRSK